MFPGLLLSAFLLLLPPSSLSLAAAGTGAAPATANARPTPPVSFRTDVMAVLSKGGCNSGPCHGNQNGKAGFKLSLRGEDPVFDHAALTRDLFGRRVDPENPEQSLALLKPTGQLAHEGGQRFKVDSPEYRLLRAWIAEGAPDDAGTALALDHLEVTPREAVVVEPERNLSLKVEAVFAGGTRRDVTTLAVYEPASTVLTVSHDGRVSRDLPAETTVLVRYLQGQVPVRVAFIPARTDFTWSNPPEHNFIDREVWTRLRQLRLNPSELCSDSEFIRRAFLDLIGLLPTAAEARAFVTEAARDKRARLIDVLLERPEFSEFWALKWSDVLRNEEKVLDRKGVQLYYDWIRRSLDQHKPLNQFVQELLSARGSTYLHPEANFYRANRDAVTRAEAVAQVFLGARLQCAKCHNHPFDRWTQSDYYDWADVFARVRYKVLENNKRDGLDSHEFIGEQVVYVAREGHINHPRTGRPARARFLGEATPADAAAPAGDGLERVTTSSTPAEALDQLAAWVTHHPNFARAQVNWVWYQVMGRGLVEPIDDFRPTNPPTHPGLLDALAADFVGNGHDLRHLLRRILSSRTYQLSARPTPDNAEDQVNYSHVLPRRLTAEQLLDTQHQVLGLPAKFGGYPRGVRAAQVAGGSPVRRGELAMGSGEKFLALFGKPARLLACECERSGETTLTQTFQLISSPEIHALLTAADNRLGSLLRSGQPADRLVEELYWSALSRPPGPEESSAAAHALEPPEHRRAALEDLAWALLNAKEFILRH